MNENKRQTGDFTKGSIPSVVMGMALPLIAAQLVNVLYNIVDRIYIGHIPVIGARRCSPSPGAGETPKRPPGSWAIP